VAPGDGDIKGTLSIALPVKAFFAPTRNFFTGALSPGIGAFTTISKFYSAAFLPRNQYLLGVFAGVDGQNSLSGRVTDQAASLGWAVTWPACKPRAEYGWQVLANKLRDNPGDSVRAYELADRDPVPVSMAADFAAKLPRYGRRSKAIQPSPWREINERVTMKPFAWQQLVISSLVLGGAGGRGDASPVRRHAACEHTRGAPHRWIRQTARKQTSSLATISRC